MQTSSIQLLAIRFFRTFQKYLAYAIAVHIVIYLVQNFANAQNQKSHNTRYFFCESITLVRENFRELIENLKYKIRILVVVLATLRQQSDQNLPIQLRMPLPNDSKWQQQQQFRHQLKLMERQETKVYLSQVS